MEPYYCGNNFLNATRLVFNKIYWLLQIILYSNTLRCAQWRTLLPFAKSIFHNIEVAIVIYCTFWKLRKLII